MGKKACVLGFSPLAELLAKGMKQHGYEVFLGLPAGTEASKSTWIPRSPISTRALVTEGLRILHTIDDALLLFDFPNLTEPFNELSARSIESSVDSCLKGPFFLIREILNTLARQGEGCLHIVLAPSPSGGEHPVDTALRKAIIGFSDSLFALGSSNGISLHGFQGVDLEPEEYSANILSAVMNRQRNYHGRWHRFGTNQGLLSSLTLFKNTGQT